MTKWAKLSRSQRDSGRRLAAEAWRLGLDVSVTRAAEHYSDVQAEIGAVQIPWQCRHCDNRAHNLRSNGVYCALCGRREARYDWYRLAAYRGRLPQAAKRVALVEDTGRWHCVECLGSEYVRRPGVVSPDIECLRCERREQEVVMRALALRD